MKKWLQETTEITNSEMLIVSGCLIVAGVIGEIALYNVAKLQKKLDNVKKQKEFIGFCMDVMSARAKTLEDELKLEKKINECLRKREDQA